MERAGGCLCPHSGQREEDTPLTLPESPRLCKHSEGSIRGQTSIFLPRRATARSSPFPLFLAYLLCARGFTYVTNVHTARCHFPLSYRIRNRGSERVSNLPTVTQPERGGTGEAPCSLWGLQQTLGSSTSHMGERGVEERSQLLSLRLFPQMQEKEPSLVRERRMPMAHLGVLGSDPDSALTPPGFPASLLFF